jgi:hypothetical protein
VSIGTPSTTRSAATVPSGTAALRAQGNVRFGGLERLGNTLDSFVPFTQAISEDFFSQFMVLDGLGLWMARIWNSITRGRTPYKPEDDPTWNSNLNEAQQLGKIANGTLKGLNWGYFLEEAGREFLIGPGVFSTFATTYGLYRAFMNPAIRLSMPALTQLTDTLGQHIQAQHGHKALTPAQFKASTLNMLNGAIPDGALKSTIAQPLQDWTQAWGQYLDTAHQYQTTVSRQQHLAWSAKHWWNTRPINENNPRPPAKALAQLIQAEQQLESTAEQLRKAVVAFNHAQPNTPYDALHKLPLNLIDRNSNSGQLKTLAQNMDIDQFLNWTFGWRHVPKTLMQQANPKTPARQAVAKLLGQLTRSKFLGAMGGLIIVGVYTLMLTANFQSSKAYPGNKSRRADDLTSGGSPPNRPQKVGTP